VDPLRAGAAWGASGEKKTDPRLGVQRNGRRRAPQVLPWPRPPARRRTRPLACWDTLLSRHAKRDPAPGFSKLWSQRQAVGSTGHMAERFRIYEHVVTSSG